MTLLWLVCWVLQGDKDVMTLDFFRQSQDVLKAIYDLDPQTPPKIQGILWHDDGPTLHRDVSGPTNAYVSLFACKGSSYFRLSWYTYRLIDHEYTVHEHCALIIEMASSVASV